MDENTVLNSLFEIDLVDYLNNGCLVGCMRN